jgi:hypothetical protein
MRRLIAGSVPGHRVADGTAKRPESLCLILLVPSSGRRVPPPPGTLLPGPSSYGLIRQSAWLSSPSAFRLVQGVCAGCYQALLPRGSSRRYLCESFSGCLSLYPGGPPECSCLVLPQSHRPSPGMDRVGFPLLSANTIFHGTIFGAAAISLCSGLCVCSPPRSFLPLQKNKILCRAAEAFTSELSVRRYLRTHRICYPPDYRQLAERGLTPRKILSLVGCSPHRLVHLHPHKPPEQHVVL